MPFVVSEIQDTDVLIAGAGLAALRAVHTVRKKGLRVTMAAAGRLCSGSSFSPFTEALGCQCPANDEDKEAFLEEIIQISCKMEQKRLNEIYIDEVTARVEELPEMGIPAHVVDLGRAACFAKTARKLAIWKDWDGIRAVVSAKMLGDSGVNVMEHTRLICLVKDKERVAGALALNQNGALILLRANAVVLATGGFGKLFQHSFNVSDVGGDGHALALFAGASMVNAEFIQFIPGLLAPAYNVILGEHTLKYCNGLLDQNGQDILTSHLSLGQSIQDMMKIRGGHGPFTARDGSGSFDRVLLEAYEESGYTTGAQLLYSSRILEDQTEAMRRYLRWLKEDKKVDLLHDRITVVPFAHACNGGVLIDEDGFTGVPGLYAAGEIAGGIHGADRMGGNATGSCIVFGHRAGLAAAKFAQKTVKSTLTVLEAVRQMEAQYGEGTAIVTPEEVLSELSVTMWRNANVSRSEESIRRAKDTLFTLKKNFSPLAFFQEDRFRAGACRAALSMELANALLFAMDLRKESRGAHFRKDYPTQNDRQFGQRLIFRRKITGEMEQI